MDCEVRMAGRRAFRAGLRTSVAQRILDWGESFLAEPQLQDQAECFVPLAAVVFRYNFGYIHQFGLFSRDYAKLQWGLDLQPNLIMVYYAYLSKIYGVRGKLKIRRGQPRGGSTPPPGTKMIYSQIVLTQ